MFDNRVCLVERAETKRANDMWPYVMVRDVLRPMKRVTLKRERKIITCAKFQKKAGFVCVGAAPNYKIVFFWC